MDRARHEALKESTRCAEFLKALADPSRLQIIRALQAGELTVSDVAQLLEAEFVKVSHHLRVLYNARLVTTRREGKYIYYSLSKDVQKRRANGAEGAGGSLDFGCCKLELRS
jgi:DNA-binding transcriptional ArsR family regulator